MPARPRRRCRRPALRAVREACGRGRGGRSHRCRPQAPRSGRRPSGCDGDMQTGYAKRGAFRDLSGYFRIMSPGQIGIFARVAEPRRVYPDGIAVLAAGGYRDPAAQSRVEAVATRSPPSRRSGVSGHARPGRPCKTPHSGCTQRRAGRKPSRIGSSSLACFTVPGLFARTTVSQPGWRPRGAVPRREAVTGIASGMPGLQTVPQQPAVVTNRRPTGGYAFGGSLPRNRPPTDGPGSCAETASPDVSRTGGAGTSPGRRHRTRARGRATLNTGIGAAVPGSAESCSRLLNGTGSVSICGAGSARRIARWVGDRSRSGSGRTGTGQLPARGSGLYG